MSVIEIIENYGRALKVGELAELTQISERSLYRLIKMGKIPVYQIGIQVRLDPKSTADWLRRRSK